MFPVLKIFLYKSALYFPAVNVGDYIQAVLDRNLAENISRVLYPNDNVSVMFFFCNTHSYFHTAMCTEEIRMTLKKVNVL